MVVLRAFDEGAQEREEAGPFFSRAVGSVESATPTRTAFLSQHATNKSVSKAPANRTHRGRALPAQRRRTRFELRDRRVLPQLQRGCRHENHRGRESEPQGQSSLRRQPASEEAAAVWPVEPIVVHRLHRTRDSATVRTPILGDRTTHWTGDPVKHHLILWTQVGPLIDV